MSTLAGTVGVSGMVDGVGTEASFGIFGGITVDSNGLIYVSEAYSDPYSVQAYHNIRAVTDTGAFRFSFVLRLSVDVCSEHFILT